MLNESLLIEDMRSELCKIRQILEFIAREDLEKTLEKIATTRQRKIIWSLIDGLLSTDEIAKRAKVSQRSVQLFLKELSEADLVEYERRGYPKRKFDYIPSTWKMWIR